MKKWSKRLKQLTDLLCKWIQGKLGKWAEKRENKGSRLQVKEPEQFEETFDYGDLRKRREPAPIEEGSEEHFIAPNANPEVLKGADNIKGII